MQNNYNNYNPYGNYYYQKNEYAFVNGLEGAKSYQMHPNQTVMLMDSDSPVCFMKTTDNMGKATLRCFKLQEVQESELRGVINNNDTFQSQINELNDKVANLYKMINKDGNTNA